MAFAHLVPAVGWRQMVDSQAVVPLAVAVLAGEFAARPPAATALLARSGRVGLAERYLAPARADAGRGALTPPQAHPRAAVTAGVHRLGHQRATA